MGVEPLGYSLDQLCLFSGNVMAFALEELLIGRWYQCSMLRGVNTLTFNWSTRNLKIGYLDRRN